MSSVLDILNIFHSPYDMDVVEHGEICVIAILGIKRPSLQGDLTRLAVVQTVQINVSTSKYHAIHLGENESIFSGWCLRKTRLSLWW